ncbi:MAG TPA: hypothetical protein VGM56_23865, partial [Byssovorax sp.]
MRARERGPAGDALVEDAPEREHVRARVDGALAARLLGRDVPGRADEDAGLGEQVRIGPHPGDAEIE